MKNVENLPDEYKGLSKEYLLKILQEIGSPRGTRAPKEHISIMSEMLRKYKVGVHADKAGDE